VRFDRSGEYDATSHIISLDIGKLRSAKTEQEVENALLTILEQVYHESEHAYNPDYRGHSGPGDIQETIEYLEDQGEIEAFGRQFAFRYSKEYPNKEFDLSKMIALCQKLKDLGEGTAHYNYFVLFADPVKQEKYGSYGNIKEINEKIIDSTKRHFTLLTSGQSA
jgi:hypothetical protein